MTRNQMMLSLAVALAVLPPRWVAAAEICGDGQDNDADGMADEGCYPAGVTGVCEQPLSCAQSGAVAPKTGALVYRFPPDLNPKVPYGPGISFQRVYASLYTPGVSFPSYRAPMGHRFQHNWMSWLELDTSADPDEVVLHTTKGQDVLFTYDQKVGSYHYYTPQPGFHIDYLRQKATGSASSRHWEVRTLTGMVYEYDWSSPIGKLIAVKDSVGNEVAVGYNGDGQVETVTDASGNKYLKFEYFSTGSKLLQYVKLYTEAGGTDTLQVTSELTYTSDKIATVKLGATKIHEYTYTSNYLTLIEDGDGMDGAAITYVSGSAGKVESMLTPQGDVTYDYSYGSCTGTAVYYHRFGTMTGCTTDASCQGGLCAADGLCYQVRRCVAVSSPNEDLVGTISAEVYDEGSGTLSYPAGTAVSDYAWNTDGGVVDLEGTKDPTGVWTSYERNANALATKVVEGDTDSNPATVPAGARVTYSTYGNSSFPGRVTEVRRLSELKPSGTCNASTTTDCRRTIYTYNASGLLSSTQEIGFTYNTSGATISYSYTTSYTYDSVGRRTQVDGPLSGSNDVVDYTYWSSTDLLKDEYLKEVKRKKDASNYVTTMYDEYDRWGNAGRNQEPDGTVTCRSWDSLQGYEKEVRVAMNSQTTCASAHSSDLVTKYTRDTWGRLVKIEKPKGNCLHYEYEAARIKKIKFRDDCNTASAGDTIEFFYDDDGLRTKVEHRNQAGTLTFKKEMTYGEGRRLASVANPVSTSYVKDYSYYDDGMPKDIAHENGLGKTEWLYDDLNRRDAIRRYTGTSTYETWDITPGVQLDLATQVDDPDSNAIDWVWDDLGRKVKQVTPESGTTLYVYDAAGRMTTRVEADGRTGEVSHTFTYDNLGRVTAENYGSISCGTGQGAEIQYVYDSVSGGCPTGADCTNQESRLAYVKTKLWCDTAKSDKTFDQETYFAYDDAGRKVQEYTEDDGSRTATIDFAWDDNGNPLQVTAPSGAAMGWNYNYTVAGFNDDMDRQIRVWRLEDSSTTYITTGGRWDNGVNYAYRHYNTLSGKYMWTRRFTNLAGRIDKLWIEWDDPATSYALKIDHTEDDKGRVTVRDFTNGATGVRDGNFIYDKLDRVTCDSTGSNPNCDSAPTKAALVYSDGGDRTSYKRVLSSYGNHTYSTSYVTSMGDEISTVTYASGANTVDFTWDDRGLRTQDDDDSVSNDTRDYTYDGRGNVLTVRTKYRVGASGTWNYLTTTNAYDHKNRRIFKSEYDETLQLESQWFFYYDGSDRLLEVKHTPNIASSTYYTVYQFYWLGSRPVAYWQNDFGGTPTVTRRYLVSDELNRPVEAWEWPTSGDSTRVWAIDPDVFGWDDELTGNGVYQPLRFPGQYHDEWTTAWADYQTPQRPPLHYNHHRHYDPFTGTYLQVDPKVDATWDAYSYVSQNPVGNTDKDGRFLRWRSPTVSAGAFEDAAGCTDIFTSPDHRREGGLDDPDKWGPTWGEWYAGLGGATLPDVCQDDLVWNPDVGDGRIPDGGGSDGWWGDAPRPSTCDLIWAWLQDPGNRNRDTYSRAYRHWQALCAPDPDGDVEVPGIIEGPDNPAPRPK